jgi:transglutaminase-like putative cysteine protease
MHLRIYHRTTYFYRTTVRDSYNEVRLRQATNDESRLEFFLLNIQPPVRLQHFRDANFNYVHFFEIAAPHSQLSIEAQSIVNTTTQYSKGPPLGVPFSKLEEEDNDFLAPFLAASHYIQITPEIWRLAIDIRGDQNGIFETGVAIMEHINQHWTYAPNTTDASTQVAQIMELKQGVCQDFAHLMIAICRALKIPARYVSGYLYNRPDGTLRGAQASHAWCEIHVPGHGWFGLDPTNNTWAEEHHVKIATGRDYQEAAPVSGHFDGPPGATTGLEIKLSIESLE